MVKSRSLPKGIDKGGAAPGYTDRPLSMQNVFPLANSGYHFVIEDYLSSIGSVARMVKYRKSATTALMKVSHEGTHESQP